MADTKDIKLAKFLARLVMEAGEARLAELGPALEKLLEGRTSSSRKAFLKEFHKAAVREIHKDTLIVESAKPLEPEVLDKLVSTFSESHTRALQVVQKTNPSLIAGMRVRLGDTVYDASLANNLKTLADRIH